MLRLCSSTKNAKRSRPPLPLTRKTDSKTPKSSKLSPETSPTRMPVAKSKSTSARLRNGRYEASLRISSSQYCSFAWNICRGMTLFSLNKQATDLCLAQRSWKLGNSSKTQLYSPERRFVKHTLPHPIGAKDFQNNHLSSHRSGRIIPPTQVCCPLFYERRVQGDKGKVVSRVSSHLVEIRAIGNSRFRATLMG